MQAQKVRGALIFIENSLLYAISHCTGPSDLLSTEYRGDRSICSAEIDLFGVPLDLFYAEIGVRSCVPPMLHVAISKGHLMGNTSKKTEGMLFCARWHNVVKEFN